ncbi:MAG: uroporphyrinogen-III synthase [Parachlamydiaceae bacterium]|nr:uroporphyrinogen-III synthase [Parachlamydiaceae bacterium]
MKKILYLGLDLPCELQGKEVTHCPLIKIQPRPKEHAAIMQAFAELSAFTHLIFTSKSAVRIFFDYAAIQGVALIELNLKIFLAVGQKTAQELKNYGITQVIVASAETAEGVIALLATLDLKNSFLFWPHSVLSRSLITDWLQAQQLKHYACIFYDTVLNIPEPLPDISSYDEIIFTSPSTIDAFCAIFEKLPINKTLSCIGPITEKYLKDLSLKDQTGRLTGNS